MRKKDVLCCGLSSPWPVLHYVVIMQEVTNTGLEMHAYVTA